MSRYAFSIDLDRCIGCQACVVACKTGNERPAGDSYTRVAEIIRGEMPNLFGSFVHQRCFHCAEAACVQVCPTGTLSKQDGLTAVNADKCSGCGYCANACPFKIPNLAENRVSKCVACLDLVKNGAEPWCAQTCPSNAIQFGERDKILADARARIAHIKAQYPNAQLYGETQLGGLGLIYVLLDQPSVYGLPENPQIPAELGAWQQLVQPGSIGLSLLGIATTGLSLVIARRQHAHEKESHPVTESAAETPAAKKEGEA